MASQSIIVISSILPVASTASSTPQKQLIVGCIQTVNMIIGLRNVLHDTHALRPVKISHLTGNDFHVRVLVDDFIKAL